MSLPVTAWLVAAALVVGLVGVRVLLHAVAPLVDPVAPLVARRRAAAPPPRPDALLEWEAALLRARDHGRAARTVLGTRMAPLVAAAPAAVDEDPTWARLRPDRPHDGRGGVPLAAVAALVDRLEGS